MAARWLRLCAEHVVFVLHQGMLDYYMFMLLTAPVTAI